MNKVIDPKWKVADLIKFAIDQALESEKASLLGHDSCTDEESEHYKAETRGRIQAMRRYRHLRFGAKLQPPTSGMHAGAMSHD